MHLGQGTAAASVRKKQSGSTRDGTGPGNVYPIFSPKWMRPVLIPREHNALDKTRGMGEPLSAPINVLAPIFITPGKGYFSAPFNFLLIEFEPNSCV